MARTRYHTRRAWPRPGAVGPVDDHLLRSHARIWVAMTVCFVLASCGGSSSPMQGTMPSSTPGPVSLLGISPERVILTPGQSQTFAINAQVTWSVAEGAAGGTISSSGVYKAPAVPGSYTVVADSRVANETWFAPVLVRPPIEIAPTAAIVGPGRSTTFSAVVTGPTNTDVTWHVMENLGGAVSTAGVYSAPATLGFYHVVATSVADASLTQSVPVSVVASGFFRPTGSMRSNAARGLTATPLTSGKVLVVSGAAELYDASTESFALTRNTTALLTWHTATALNNGTVLLTGGAGGYSELYDPVADTFTATGSMLDVGNHYAHTATLLSDGRVLIAGGYKNLDGTAALGTAEIYDPATRTFTATGKMIIRRSSHTATLLADGTVLIAGGFNLDGGPINRAELYDPVKGTFAPTGDMTTSRGAHSATLLLDGKVLVAGGFRVLTAEVYDPKPRSFSPTGNLALARADHSATLLSDGKVLIAGGRTGPFFGEWASSTSELYDPLTGMFSASGTMQVGRNAHAATLLPSGSVLVVGGAQLASAELYQ